ncbi:hypothetical protein P3S68_007092 [Capsicum galapagoense]
MSEFPSPEDGGGEMTAHDNVGSKRHRRPNVRLGDVGGSGAGEYSSFEQRRVKNNKATKNNRHNQTLAHVVTNPNEHRSVEEDDNTDANLDDVAIGSWKIKNLKSKKGAGAITKKMRTGWTSKSNDKMLSTDVDDLENNENSVQSPVDHYKINDDNVNMVIDIDRRIGNVNVNSSRKRGTRVSEDGQTDPEARDLNVGSERNGVKVWLNQLGLGQYASLFEIHEVDDEVLPMLTLEDLKDMGISAVGSRRKMYCSIQDLNKDFS